MGKRRDIITGKRKRRTRLFIIKNLQLRYILFVLSVMFIVAFISGYTVYITIWMLLGEKLADVYPQGFLKEMFGKVNLVLFSRLLLISPVVVFIALFLSNKVAGPIYSLKRFVKKLSKGNYTGKLKLREYDELHDVADEMNILAEKLDSIKTYKKKRFKDCAEALSKLEDLIVSGQYDDKDILNEINNLKRHINGTDIRDIEKSGFHLKKNT